MLRGDVDNSKSNASDVTGHSKATSQSTLPRDRKTITPLGRVRISAGKLAGASGGSLKNTGLGGTLYMLCSYTPTHEFRRIMQKRGWVKHFWEE